LKYLFNLLRLVENPLPSADDITAIAELEKEAGAIIIAQDEIACLDNMSLEGDIPGDISDIVEVQETTLTGS
jgi:hypothetical protein